MTTTELIPLVGQTVEITGWVHRIRKHKKVLFLDLRDRNGMLQIVTGAWQEAAFTTLLEADIEDVITVTGLVKARTEDVINENMATGTIELEATAATIVATSEVPPFSVNEDTRVVDEDLRLKYRYLDLRSERMAKNIRMRAKVVSNIRSYLDNEAFIEVETPILTASTPEGARDYLVPTRRKGEFFAMPQSPQQFKQLLMSSGIEKYYQIARCFRDEDARGDRQPEFTQLDMEISHVSREDVMELNEKLLIHVVETLYPEKKIQQVPFPRMSYKEAMEKYGNDRPDLRNDKEDPNLLAFCWVIDFPFFEKDEETGNWTFTHNPFSMPIPDHVGMLENKEGIADITTTQYDIALNGYEIGGGSIRNHLPDLLAKTFEVMSYSPEELEQGFGHMLTAFKHGTPPHGGIAWGLDRFLMILQNESSIREVIAFPKNGEGRDPLMQAPTQVSEKQLRDLGLQIKASK